VRPADRGYYSDPPLLVLASLADGPKHGYAMITDIEQMSGTRLGPGALYGAITRLERQGLITRLDERDRRQPYRITPEGRKVLRAKLETLRAFSHLGLKRLGSGTAPSSSRYSRKVRRRGSSSRTSSSEPGGNGREASRSSAGISVPTFCTTPAWVPGRWPARPS